MTCSPAQLAANRANAPSPRGPTSPEGKAISRRNALKHGLAGSGIVVPDEDSAEVERRHAALTLEMAPNTVIGRFQVGRVAALTVRVESSTIQERAATAHRMAHAAEAVRRGPARRGRRADRLDRQAAGHPRPEAPLDARGRRPPDRAPDRACATRSARPGGTGSTARRWPTSWATATTTPRCPGSGCSARPPGASSSTSTPRTAPAWPTRPGGSGRCSN